MRRICVQYTRIVSELNSAVNEVYVSKNDTDVAHYNFNTQTDVFLAEMLLKEYIIERLFVIPPLFTHVCALPGET